MWLNPVQPMGSTSKITENLDGRAAAAFGKDPADFNAEDRKHLADEIASDFKNLN